MDPNDYFYEWNPVLFRKATRHLTALQRGIYRDLIDEYMETREPLPASDIALANIARISVEEWTHAKKEILEFFEEKDGKLFQEYCNEKLDRQDTFAKKRSKASRKAASKRWEHKRKPKMPDACEPQCEPDAIGMPQNAKGKERKGRKEIFKEKNLTEEDFGRFWEAYPRDRRGNREKALGAYCRALERAKAGEIQTGLERYAKSEEVAKGYAKGAQAWLNDDRWASDYKTTPGGGLPDKPKIETGDWPDWKKKLAARIGETNVFSWFSEVSFENGVFKIPKPFQRQKIQTEFLIDLEAVFGDGIRISA